MRRPAAAATLKPPAAFSATPLCELLWAQPWTLLNHVHTFFFCFYSTCQQLCNTTTAEWVKNAHRGLLRFKKKKKKNISKSQRGKKLSCLISQVHHHVFPTPLTHSWSGWHGLSEGPSLGSSPAPGPELSGQALDCGSESLLTTPMQQQTTKRTRSLLNPS